MGLRTLAVGGVGNDLMGDWVLERLKFFGVDHSGMQQKPEWKTSSSIVTTRQDGSRPALHMRGATADFYVDDMAMAQAINTKVLHVGGVGLMKAMDTGRTAELMQQAKKMGASQLLMFLRAHPKISKPLLKFFRTQIILCHPSMKPAPLQGRQMLKT